MVVPKGGMRELDERLGFGELIGQHLTDSRGKNTQLPLAGLLRQSVYRRSMTGDAGSWFLPA